MNKQLLSRKMHYIPQCASGEISIRHCARLIGISPQAVCSLKKRYKKYGIACFIHGNTGRVPKNTRYDAHSIETFYREQWPGAPFAVFNDYLNKEKQLNASYTTVYRHLRKAGIKSPKARMTQREKKEHLPRKERPHEGDMMQIDGSPHDWFMTGETVTLHGAIDDATHKIVALYFCKNECLLGYYELLQQTYDRYNGFPLSIYSDRSACFFNTKQSQEKVNLQEQLKGMRKHPTQWQETCKALKIDLIAALSPQEKGRIERLWQTLQGRLPFIFRFHKITTIEAANEFLKDFIDGFNAQFAVPAQEEAIHYHKPKKIDLEYLLSVRKDCKTKTDGTFLFDGYQFHLEAPYAARKEITVCLSERHGVYARMDDRYYPVELCEPLSDCVGDPMPIVVKDLLYRYLYADAKSGCALICTG